MTAVERWKTYGVNKGGPGVTYYQGQTDAPENGWLVRESDYLALAVGAAPCPVCAESLPLTPEVTCPTCHEPLRAGWLYRKDPK